MGLIAKLKLLFEIQKPFGEAVDAVAEAKKTKKWVHFTVTLLGVLLSTVLALNGVIPPQYALIATTALQALYNIIRGADKADNEDIKGTLRTTEFWTTGLTEIQKGIVAVQTGGVSAEWLTMSSTIIGMALAAGQNLAARAPDPTGESKGLETPPK